jgi:hypothetical protein
LTGICVEIRVNNALAVLYVTLIDCAKPGPVSAGAAPPWSFEPWQTEHVPL